VSASEAANGHDKQITSEIKKHKRSTHGYDMQAVCRVIPIVNGEALDARLGPIDLASLTP
jgi:hypothetical protein